MPAADTIHSPSPEEVMEYLDGEGTAASRAAIEAHLVTCTTCREVVSGQREISARTTAWTVDEAPLSLKVPASPRAPARILALRPSRAVLGAMAVAAAVLLVVALWEPSFKRPIPEESMSRAEVPRAVTPQPEISVLADRASALESARAPSSQAMASPSLDSIASPGAGGGALRPMAEALVSRRPMVIRTAGLNVVAKEFSGIRPAVEAIVAEAGGFIDDLTVTGDGGAARQLRGTLRIPGDRMAAVLERLRRLGQVVEDTQGAQDVTDQIVDLDARMLSSRATERRLIELLRTRTGKLTDVLEVERELTRVRLEIERLDAEKTNLDRRVSYGTIAITISEERKAGLAPGPLSLATRVRIAAADGLEAALETIVSAVLLVLRVGPMLIVWLPIAAATWFIARAWALRRTRRSAQ